MKFYGTVDEALARSPLRILADGESHQLWPFELDSLNQPVGELEDQDTMVVREALSVSVNPLTRCGYARCVSPEHVLHWHRDDALKERNRWLREYRATHRSIVNLLKLEQVALQLRYAWQGAFLGLTNMGFTRFNSIRLLQRDRGTHRIPEPLKPAVEGDPLLNNLLQERWRRATLQWETRWRLTEPLDSEAVADEELRAHEPRAIQIHNPETSRMSIESLEAAIDAFIQDGVSPPAGLFKELDAAKIAYRRALLEQRLVRAAPRPPSNGFH